LDKKLDLGEMPKTENVEDKNFGHIGIYPTVIRERYNITKEVGQHPENR
jgi:hypothetical protein